LGRRTAWLRPFQNSFASVDFGFVSDFAGIWPSVKSIKQYLSRVYIIFASPSSPEDKVAAAVIFPPEELKDDEPTLLQEELAGI
jgi:hypothetical protein